MLMGLLFRLPLYFFTFSAEKEVVLKYFGDKYFEFSKSTDKLILRECLIVIIVASQKMFQSKKKKKKKSG